MSTPRARLTTAVAASTAALLVLSACGDDSDSDSDTAGSDSSSSASSESSSKDSGSKDSESKKTSTTLAEPKKKDQKVLESIDVTPPTKDKGPKIKVDEPVKVSQTTLDVLKQGKGEKTEIGDFAKVDVAMFNAKNGKPIKQSSTYGDTAAYLPLTSQPQGLSGLIKAINGQKVGTQAVAVLPPEDLFGAQGNPQFGIDGKDNVIVVFDVRGILPDKADGEDVAPKKGMPKVTWSEDDPADITIPKGEKKPKKLQVEHLKKGDGETVKKGDIAYVHYTGVTWDDGKVFDSSKKGKEDQAFPVGVGQGQVIPAWDKALEGAKVGDRLLIVAPPKEAYGKQANGPIKANSTLVFSVDVLGKG